MERKKTIQIQHTGGRRLELYAELGKYFYPDSTFDEQAFRDSLREIIARKYEESRNDENPKDDINNFINNYLEEIINYLHEKGLYDASYTLFQTAVDEFAKTDIKSIVISPKILKKIFAHVPSKDKNTDEKRNGVDDKKGKIFNAALQVFADKGYHRATIDEIVAISGVGKGSVYRYFKNKEDLLEQLLQEKYKEIVSMFKSIFSRDISVLQQIEEMIERWIIFIEENYVVYKLIQDEAVTYKDGSKEMFYDYFISQLPMFKERIVALNKQHRIKTTNFYTVFYGIMGFIDGVVHKWFRNGMSYPLIDEVPVIQEVLFNGFVGAPDTPRRFFIPPEEEQ